MNLAQVNEAMQHKITEGSEYGWLCWNNARYLDYESDYAGVSVVYNTKTQEIYQAEVSTKIEGDIKPYRWLNPAYKEALFREAGEREVDPNQAWDDVKWYDLETEEDWLEKATAIFNGEEFDERVQVPLDLENDMLLELALEAHRRDITLNKMVEIVLERAIEYHKKNGIVNSEDC